MKDKKVILYVLIVLALLYPLYELGKVVGAELYKGNLILLIIIGLVLAYPANYLGKKVGKYIGNSLKGKR